jgi:hypothetical protein
VDVDGVDPLKPEIPRILFKNSVRTEEKTPRFTVTDINRLTLFKEIIAVSTENHSKSISKNGGGQSLLK